MNKFLLVPVFALALGACSETTTQPFAPESAQFSRSVGQIDANRNQKICYNETTGDAQDDVDGGCEHLTPLTPGDYTLVAAPGRK